MPKMSDIALIYQNLQPALTIRTRTKVQELPSLIGESYGRLAAYLNELGELMADVPFVAYHNMDMQDLDVEIGFPVARPLSGKDGIQPSSIPAGRAVICMYRGAYAEMEPLYNEIAQWIAEQGLEASGTVYEYYYNGPGFPESELLTKIVMRLK